MFYYYYIKLSRSPIRSKAIRQSTLYPDYALLECFRELTDDLIDKHKLVYIGRGYITDKHIQTNIGKVVERL